MDWNAEELSVFEREDEVELASARPDGTLRKPAVIWTVRVGDDVFVRSAYGTTNRWFVHASQAGSGSVEIGSISRRARFEDVSASADHAAIDAAYQAKYGGRFPAQYVRPVTDDASRAATLKVTPEP